MHTKGFFVLFFIVILLAPMSLGDGVPLISVKLHSITHENRQIAVVDVHGDSETLHLFLSVVSLAPGKNITLLIPVRTAPSDIYVENTTERDFYWNNNITNASYQHEREINGVQGVYTSYAFSALLFTTTPVTVPVLGWLTTLYLLSMGVAGSGSSSGTTHFSTGDSAVLYNFTSYKDVREFYSRYNMSVPSYVNDTLARYSSFHIIALNLRTRAPIPENEYRELLEKCPETMEKVREYVKTHPWIRVKAEMNYFVDMPSDFSDVERTLEREAGENSNLYDYFWDMIASIYGYGNIKGIALTVVLPLYDGEAFYPLGTSPAWGSSGEIRVLFRVPENRSMSFNMPADYMVRCSGYRYYFWNFDGKLPSQDIVGSVHGIDLGTWLADRNEEFCVYLYESNGLVGFVLGMASAVGIWFSLLAVLVQIYGGSAMFRDRRFIWGIFGGALLTVFVSGMLGIFLIYYLLQRKFNRMRVNHDESAYSRAAQYTAVIVLTISAIGISAFILFMSGHLDFFALPRFLLGVYFFISLTLLVLILVRYALHRVRGKLSSG